MNQFLFLRHRSVRDPTARQQQLDRTSSAGFGIGMHCAKRFPHRHGIAELAMQNYSNRRIDRIFLLLASAAKDYASVANGFTVNARHKRSEERRVGKEC